MSLAHTLRLLGFLFAAIAGSLTCALPARAQDALERERNFCQPGLPANNCAGLDCICLEDTLEITFDGASRSVLEYAAYEAGAPVDTVIVTETRTRGIQGWSYAVEHDDAFLDLLEVTVDGTEAGLAKPGGFVMASGSNLTACPHWDLDCRDAVPAAGYISVVIFNSMDDATLPLERNRLCVARYALRSDPGPRGTLIQVVDQRLGKAGGPPFGVNFTVGSRPGKPAKLIDGWVKAAGTAVLEVCGNGIDDDGDGKADCDDRECFDGPGCRPENCTNSFDDDRDGLGDCADADCSDAPECVPPEICDNYRDDDADGFKDCDDDDCRAEPYCGPEVCNNHRDDDGDGFVDCDDPKCRGTVICWPRPEICDNAWDDDRDGAVDCDDWTCVEAPECPPRPEVCGGFRDEDRDGLVDCDDPDCAADEECLLGPERRRLFCDAAAPERECPWPECRCTLDTLEVTFDGKSDTVLQYESFLEGAAIETVIVMDTRSPGIQGWSYSVEHDASFLSITGVTTDGTVADALMSAGFDLTDARDIEACLPADAGCQRPVPGSGYISVVMLAFLQPIFLPVDRNTICRASYALAADPGPEGTLIRVVDGRLKKKGSPPVDVNFTIDGLSHRPGRIVDGWVKATGRPQGELRASFIRGDADGSGRVNVSDAVVLIQTLAATAPPRLDCNDLLDATDDGRFDARDVLELLRFVFLRGPDLPSPFPSCGRDPTAEPQALGCRESTCG